MKTVIRSTIRKCLSEKANLKFIKDELNINSEHTPNSLTRLLCEKFSFISPVGKMRTGSCKTALAAIMSREKIVFPKSRKPGKTTYTPMLRLNAEVPLPPSFPKSVGDIKDQIEIILIGEKDSYLKKVWNELMATEHPLGETRLCGYQVKYLIAYASCYIGACGFSSSALKLEARDKWLSWSEGERERYQSRVLNMSRFLIRNGINCKNLASHLLSRLLKHFKIDFHERYGIRPWLVETFVDTDNYSGTCYKAANWQCLGQTKGRGRNDRYWQNLESVKDIYIYPLESGFRKLAGLRDPIAELYAPMSVETGLSSSEWAAQEFGGIELGDQRLTQRLVKVAADKGEHPTDSYPKAVSGDRYAIKGYYNFLSNNNEQITFEQLLSQHKNSTIKRINSCGTVYAIQDTCDLNYSGLKQTTGLGKIGKNGKNSGGSSGLALHSTFIVDERGLPFGVPYAECVAPEINNKHDKKRHKTPIEEKESYKWLTHYQKTLELARNCPGTNIISIMDREADIFELWELACDNRKKVPVVIRAQHNRILKNSELPLFDYLESLPVATSTKIMVPPQRSREKTTKKEARPYIPEREAELRISYGEVTIAPSKTPVLRHKAPLTLCAVYAREVDPPEGAEPIQWMLLTTINVDSPEKAVESVGIYKRRWRIEEFHRVLKSGCHVEKHKQDTAEKLKRVIALDMVIAWRIMLLTLLGRECPEISADIMFSKNEMLALNLIAEKKTADNKNDKQCD